MNLEYTMRSFLVSLAILFILAQSSVFALDHTPVRISLASNPYDVCANKKTTIGLDLALWSGSTCRVFGAQLASNARAGDLAGLQFGILSNDISRRGYGLQIAGLGNFTACKRDETMFSGVQIAGLANGLFWDCPGVKMQGVQIAGFFNNAGDFTGVQVGAVNFSSSIVGMQTGLLNFQEHNNEGKSSGTSMQIGAYNYAEDMIGLQLGIVNRAENLRGVQLGLVNIVSKKYRKLPVPFTPILNVGW